ncbi:MAG: SDR family oxidoreductase [Paracoccus sp. (in: a-proteobacteria)]|nr:SDR family oxidoreductase [Paracoccus sp. (in: a-proteobacteria)]
MAGFDDQQWRGSALVTGACGGIGAAVARRLSADGWRLAVTDLDLERAQSLAASLAGEGHIALRCDVSDEASVAAVFHEIEAHFGKAEGLVTAAGVLRLGPGGQRTGIADMDVADFDEHMAVNSRGTFLCLRAWLRQWRDGARPHGGRAVTFASVAAQLGGYRSSASYIASKGAVMALTKAAAREIAPMGATVNAVAPGLIDAPMLRLSLAPGQEEAASAAIPLGRIGMPEDVAGAVAFLMSADAAYMTGGVLDVNGGYRMQ